MKCFHGKKSETMSEQSSKSACVYQKVWDAAVTGNKCGWMDENFQPNRNTIKYCDTFLNAPQSANFRLEMLL